MNRITKDDVNKVIEGTDIKIKQTMTIEDLYDMKIPSEWFGVYVINLKYNESYIGMSCCGEGIKSRLSKHICETWHRNITKSIDIFTTDENHANLLEKIMITTFKPELNTNMYESFCLNNDSFVADKDDNKYDYEYECKYENKYGNIYFIRWLKDQSNRDDPIGDLSLTLKGSPAINIIKNINDLKEYLKTTYRNFRNEDKILKSLDTAYNEYKYIFTTKYRDESDKFGLILIKSLIPELNEQLLSKNNFDVNYKILFDKYNEIVTFYTKNNYNTYTERGYRERINDNLSSNSKLAENQWRENNIAIREIWVTKQSLTESNYYKLVFELDNEIEKLLRKYCKNRDCIKESFYNQLINHDIEHYIRHILKNENNTKEKSELLEDIKINEFETVKRLGELIKNFSYNEIKETRK